MDWPAQIRWINGETHLIVQQDGEELDLGEYVFDRIEFRDGHYKMQWRKVDACGG